LWITLGWFWNPKKDGKWFKVESFMKLYQFMKYCQIETKGKQFSFWVYWFWHSYLWSFIKGLINIVLNSFGLSIECLINQLVFIIPWWRYIWKYYNSGWTYECSIEYAT